MHPADELRGVKSAKLSRKRIVLGVTGSIAAVESVQLARELIRHGADVIPVMTKAATRILHPDALEFATGHEPIVELTGKTEHVALCGLVSNPVDLLLISPCTANTLSKIALGVDDTPVSTFATTAIGSGIPVIVVPAMHLSMYKHRIVQENMKRIRGMGILVVDPVVSGNKAKMSGVDDLVALVIQCLGAQDFSGKKILIIGGATRESVDDIRVLTNRSSGKTAVFLAVNAFERGAQVDLWYGYGEELVPPFLSCTRFESVTELLKLVQKQKLTQYDGIVVCAAIANYIPHKYTGKFPSGSDSFVIECSRAPIVLEELRRRAPDVKLVAFKAEEKKADVKGKALRLLKTYHLNGVVGNTLSGFGAEENEILLVNVRGESVWRKGKKEELVSFILDSIKKMF
ncbi:MAG: bifunctional phosphopantothenoylcysteine decarboxylase/phosphopantothenate--cysteine ligase CoaBC [Methanobacteriota archaeon]